MKIRAALAGRAAEPFRLADLTLDDPRDDEVLVRVVATGICHTDLAVRDQHIATPLPIVLGHEGAGIVERVGARVGKVAVGDHVVLSLGACGVCEKCRSGLPTYCVHHVALNFGGARLDGSTCLHHGMYEVHSHFFCQSSFATRAIAPASSVVKVPKGVPLEFLGPFACGIMTGAGAVMNTLRPVPGSTLAVFGTGAVGLAAIMAARVAGCAAIVAVDIKDSRLDLARELGATHTVNGSKEDAVARIRAITEGGVHGAVESTGVTRVMTQAVDALAENGVCVITGAPPAGSRFDIDLWHLLRGRVVRGSVMGDAVPDVFIPRLVELFRQGRFPADRMMKVYELEQINQAAEDALSGATVKALLRMPH
ncbi:NAD(P)-dependent alcohol dehydrogenase [Massilia sp. YIM B04103]|uniref:NAD(P)-dependent alcohol dehydrogenase n=1 Tax=Massilia sp. YIM B04103 TaxID=2963106 RepID=UPI00210C65B2|nr:NAD(P)-dependent alcohol dehydrogenase [Massilia sp. YIM B04103]